MRLFTYECWKCPIEHPITIREAYSLRKYKIAKIRLKITRKQNG